MRISNPAESFSSDLKQKIVSKCFDDDGFVECSVLFFCAACLTLCVVIACCHSFYLFHPSLSASVSSPPTSLTLFTDSPNCIALSVSVQLCYPSQTVLSPPIFLPPNLFFVLCCLQHSLVMFFFLRSHFRTSEGDQEKIGLRKPAVKGSSTPFALQISVQHSETFRPSSSLSE